MAIRYVAALSLILSAVFLQLAFKKNDHESSASYAKEQSPARILIFYKTQGYYHTSIPLGVNAIRKMAAERNITVDTTRNAGFFTEDQLADYRAVIFLSTTMNVLNATQQVAFERYIQSGGGFVGIHSAADTEADWAWYAKLVGAQFESHPRTQTAVIRVTGKSHPSTSFLPEKWQRKDEWYNFKNISPYITVLAWLDEKTYEGGKNGMDHPIAWYHEYDGGRAFYTGGGHTDESYSDSLFLKHVWGGIEYAMGDGKPLNWKKAYAKETPEENRFGRKVLADDLNEPMELAVAGDGRVFYIERLGNFFVYDPRTRKNVMLRKFPVFAEHGNGLLGLTLDPAFSKNGWIYFFYSPVRSRQSLVAHVSRFTLTKSGLDLSSEKVLLRIPLDYEGSAHIGGSLAFDAHGNLFIGIGDNTTPSESGGFSPLDERPGRACFDAQRSASSSNDLRGKILRIHPMRNGSYTIPVGNLFPTDGSKGRPEIYVMGCRNPYRISVDSKTSIVYWGDVGPDGGKDGLQGPRGYDEFNQAKAAGNFGWPYFIGDNKPYRSYDFASGKTGEFFDTTAPRNHSLNNKGERQLPLPQKAMIWYPYEKSDVYPELGMSGRCAMAGPVYHYDKHLVSNVKFPGFYDKCLFVYDWMRNWLKVIRFDENNNYRQIEPFLELSGNFKRPVDVEFGPDGAIYMLEYGSVYGVDNEDARLVKFEYNPSNRKPVAKINAGKLIGDAPLKINFNGQSSYDPDGDDLVFEWLFDGKTVGSTEELPVHTYTENGNYQTILKVTDKSGLVSADTVMVSVGNRPPELTITTSVNQSFYWKDIKLFTYDIRVSDKEDIKIEPKRIKTAFQFFGSGAGDDRTTHGKETPRTSNASPGANLVAASDCKVCHAVNKTLVGPSFTAIALRYKNDPATANKLARKIITGGGGNWGIHYMTAHPQLSQQQAREIVNYIFSLKKPATVKTLLRSRGQLSFNEHAGNEGNGVYVLSASYTDAGTNGVMPLTGAVALTWRNHVLPANTADELYDMEKSVWMKYVSKVNSGGHLLFKDIDLTGIKRITCKINSANSSGLIEIRTGSRTGPLIGSFQYEAAGNWNKQMTIETAILPTGGKHPIYFVVKKMQGSDRNLMNIYSFSFFR